MCGKKGGKIYGDRQGKRRKRENLVPGRRKGKKDLRRKLYDENAR